MPLPNFTLYKSDGKAYPLQDYEGQVLLIVNTASSCGLANQMKELELLYQTYQDQGFTVLAFPSNQFHQENLTNEEIVHSCQLNFGSTFPIHQKIKVNGPDAAPLYKWLKLEQGGLFKADIKWNYTKFLLNRQGEVVKRYSPTKSPAKLATDIEALL